MVCCKLDCIMSAAEQDALRKRVLAQQKQTALLNAERVRMEKVKLDMLKRQNDNAAKKDPGVPVRGGNITTSPPQNAGDFQKIPPPSLPMARPLEGPPEWPSIQGKTPLPFERYEPNEIERMNSISLPFDGDANDSIVFGFADKKRLTDAIEEVLSNIQYIQMIRNTEKGPYKLNRLTHPAMEAIVMPLITDLRLAFADNQAPGFQQDFSRRYVKMLRRGIEMYGAPPDYYTVGADAREGGDSLKTFFKLFLVLAFVVICGVAVSK